ncbi:MAG: hypothetical protein KDA61_10090 [Planctomycetales bacterium]|nr:hypothetical protein [Planctomycetales bacterium]
MKGRGLLVLSMLMTVDMARADEVPAPLLRSIEERIRQSLAPWNDEISAHYENRGQTLVMGYRTRTFSLHGASMSGQRSEKPHDTTGPSYLGFLLRIHLQEAGVVNQAMTPQTLREPYWQTYLDVWPLDSSNQALAAFSYGSRLDAEVKQRLTNLWQTMSGRPAVASHVDRDPSPTDVETLSTLEGFLRIHPKFHYRYYVDGLAEGQSCALRGADDALANLKPGSRVRVRGRMGSVHFSDADRSQESALLLVDYIYLDVEHIELVANRSDQERQ